jgi:uncharacterized protein
MDFLFETWHWSISGFLIGIIMLLLTYFGKTFGMSANLRNICALADVNKKIDYFNFDWREQKWNLAVVFGAIFGGFVAYYFMSSTTNFDINTKTISRLSKIAIDAPNGKIAPEAMFSIQAVLSIKGFLILIFGGFLIGFGTPYAGGCTSGHAISGLSNFQLPSLIAVIGFFIGGLIMAHFILPLLF